MLGVGDDSGFHIEGLFCDIFEVDGFVEACLQKKILAGTEKKIRSSVVHVSFFWTSNFLDLMCA